MDELVASRVQLNRANANFLRVDLDTALTFSNLALQSQDSIKKTRNKRAARRAYETVVKLMGGVELTEEDARILADKLRRLKSELQSLGDVF
jgi:hypothetical protein